MICVYILAGRLEQKWGMPVRVLVSKYKKCMLCALVPRSHLQLVSLSESC